MSDSNARDIAIENMRALALPTSAKNIKKMERVLAALKRNKQVLYNNTFEEKEVILHHLNQKYLNAMNSENGLLVNGKNLLYFSVFLNNSYLDVLYMCLKSIIANTPNINFDVLFITDADTKIKIQQFDIISQFNADYMILSGVNSAADASMKKLNIFDYPKIMDYSKILFFDADILCIKDLNIIFKKLLNADKLYVSSTEVHKSPLLLSPTHGIMHLTRQDAEFIYDNPNIVPFNSGQFLFLNSTRIRNHFRNILWLKNIWTDLFFYEQSFMNYYFVLKSLTEPLTITTVKKYMTPVIKDGVISMDEKEVEQISQLVSITFNIKKRNDEDAQTIDLTRRLSTNRLMTVSGATNSSFSETYTARLFEMPEGLLDEPRLMHNEHTVAIHFASTLPTGGDKKTFMKLYANAHKLHI